MIPSWCSGFPCQAVTYNSVMQNKHSVQHSLKHEILTYCTFLHVMIHTSACSYTVSWHHWHYFFHHLPLWNVFHSHPPALPLFLQPLYMAWGPTLPWMPSTQPTLCTPVPRQTAHSACLWLGFWLVPTRWGTAAWRFLHPSLHNRPTSALTAWWTTCRTLACLWCSTTAKPTLTTSSHSNKCGTQTANVSHVSPHITFPSILWQGYFNGYKSEFYDHSVHVNSASLTSILHPL